LKRAVFFYISGHGFGHASRQIEVINALGTRAPHLAIVVRTSAPRWLFDRTVRVPFTLLAGECDTGITQIDSLHLDARDTIRRADAFYRTLPQRVADEAALLRAHGASFVVADAAPLGCAAAAAAGARSAVVTNFTWDWIYEAYAEELEDAPELLPAIRAAYRTASAAWRLPMHGGFATFDAIVDVPFIARHARQSRDAVRRQLGLPADRPLVLSSFGGYGVDGLDVARLDCLDDYGVVLTVRSDAECRPHAPDGILQITEDRLYGSGLRYEDLVHACDIVATKPGYGIIAECIANGTGLLYTSRGRFAEYDVLVAEMPRVLKCGFIDHDALFAGRWQHALDRIMAAPAPPERPRTDGATMVATLIYDAIDSAVPIRKA
jgi:L-arabinokinase